MSNSKQDDWSRAKKVTDSITDSLGLGIDEGIKDTIVACNLLGLYTSASCFGHAYEENRGLPYPWVDFGVEQDPSMTEKSAEQYAIHNAVKGDIRKEFVEQYGAIESWPPCISSQYTNAIYSKLEENPRYVELDAELKEKTKLIVEKYSGLIHAYYLAHPNSEIEFGFKENLPRLQPVTAPKKLQKLLDCGDDLEKIRKYGNENCNELLELTRREMISISHFLKETFFGTK